jgi:glycosyltransferase involved in cell wall biosynthesis
VTHVVFDLHGGGLESLIAALVRSLAGSSVQSSVITLGGRAGRVGESLRPLLGELEVLKPARGISMLAPVTLVRALRRQRPHVVHLHSGAWFKPAYAARLAGGASVLFTEHGRIHYDPWRQRQLDRIAALLTARVVAVSDTLAEYLHSALHIPTSKLRVIENGVDLARFSPGPRSSGLRRRLGVPDGAIVIGAIGRLEQVKGYDLLVEAFSQLRQAELPGHPRYLVIGGEGSERAALAEQANQLGVADRVIFPGWLDEPAELYRSFDVFAVSSRSEGLSLSLLEAMACGVPPVVTDVGANRLVLGDALRTLVHTQADWPGFRQSVESLLGNQELRHRLGAEATRRVTERFSLARVVEQYRALYEELTPH